MPKNSNSNAARILVCYDFELECLSKNKITNVAVVGGSILDDEVESVKVMFPNVQIETFGIEEGQLFMDLNAPPRVTSRRFDLVLCSNVIEHVFHHENFAKNLISLMKPGGVLWVSFPYNDMFHGAPSYYSAGFHPQYLSNLFARNKGVVKKSKIISSKRLYLFIHLLSDWPSMFRYNHPFLGQIIWTLGLRGNPRPPIRNISPHRLFICLYLSILPKKFTSNPDYGVSGWIKVCRS